MASIAFDTAPRRAGTAADQRFASTLAVAMAVVVVAGFSFQLAMGRSTFASPLRVHVHAIAFMGWVALFVAQAWLATRGPLALHRKLGWISLAWVGLMVASALTVIITLARNGTVPFFFAPQLFVIGDPITLIGFVGMTASAIALRKRTDWHARLHVCAMAMIMGPAFGRLIPMPLLIPWAFEIAVLPGALFPLAGMIRDKRRTGAIHPAWWCGLAVLALSLLATDALVYSPVGDAIYAKVVAGTPGAAVPGLDYPPPPDTPLRTGR